MTEGINCQPNKCWIWPHSISVDGHGHLRVGNKSTSAHRHMFQLYHNVRLASDLVVRHRCNTPSCINPAHLCLGTHEDNVIDREKSGRTFCIVSPSLRIKIQEEYDSGQYTQRRLANKYNITQSQISRIINNKTKH